MFRHPQFRLPPILPLCCTLLAASLVCQQSVSAGDRSTTIDEMLQASRPEGTAAAETIDDAAFLRRVSLDLIGRIPLVSEVRTFLNDAASDKRRRVVTRLLDDPAHVIHFTNVWRSLLLHDVDSERAAFFAPRLEAWIRQRLYENRPYDEFVRELIAAPVTTGESAADPFAYYLANELAPENVAASTSRIFLGLNLDCAQCHDHPFNAWKQERFWKFAAFFSGVQPIKPGSLQPAPEDRGRYEIDIPGKNITVAAEFLDGGRREWSTGDFNRQVLADWVASPNNPYFSTAIANRLWAHFFGRGLVEPLDQISDASASPHQKLLQMLAARIVADDFDLRPLMQDIVVSDAYQRSSCQSHDTQADPALFTRALVRGMSAEQAWASFAAATGYRPDQPLKETFAATDLKRKFGTLDRPFETRASIGQALTLMNGALVSQITDPDPGGGGTLTAVLAAPFLDDQQRIETLMLATLSRKPTPSEFARLSQLVATQPDEPARKAAFADIFWSLLNCDEFLLNH